ncbi:MAG: Maf family nucleotide pyrophosphatase [Prevotellaceae bacterium]|jgi:septum formation protein|nr:Maf family nucleotide pyrophosphatase [Prevotellaceae bacterium]
MKSLKIILASQSPRRQELIGGLDIPLEISVGYEFDETYPPEMPNSEVALYLAEKKSQAYPLPLNDNEVLLTADTLVNCEGELLGKPANKQQAKEMLKKLSGKRHEVITGVCLRSLHMQKSFKMSSFVFFADLPAEDIDYYVEKYQPLDKAGAYGVQEWIGYIGIDRIEGSYYNIMGLPLSQIWKELKQGNF